MSSPRFTAAESRLLERVTEEEGRVYINVQYGGRNDCYRHPKREVHSLQFYIDNYCSVPISEVIKGLVEVESLLGPSAEVTIEHWSSYGDSYFSLEVTGTRELDDDECVLWQSILAKREIQAAATAEKRKEAAAKARATKERKERKEYERLKKKFGA